MTYEEFTAQVAENIRKARWAAGLTQEQAGADTVGYKHYQEIENGRTVPTLPTLFRLAETLNVTVAQLTAVASVDGERKAAFLGDLDVTPPKRGRKRKG